MDAAAGGDDVIHQQDALAADEVGVIAAEVQLLHARGRDGLILHVQRIGHVDFRALAGDKVLLRAGLAGHLVDQGNALSLGGKEIIVAAGGDEPEQLAGAGLRQLCVAEADERADIQVV